MNTQNELARSVTLTSVNDGYPTEAQPHRIDGAKGMMLRLMGDGNWTPTDDVVTGDTIAFVESVFAGSWRNSRLVGERAVVAKVVSESYGELKQQHTFTLEVLTSDGEDALEPGKVKRRKGRNIYRNGVSRLRWRDEDERQRASDEKHNRGAQARAARARRLDVKVTDAGWGGRARTELRAPIG